MKIHVYLLCFNEAYIIESVIDYYAKFCSKIFILDNKSTDNSVALAKKNSKVLIHSWSSDGIVDDEKHIKIKSEIYKSHSRLGGPNTTEVADWVIVADMDEILFHPRLTEVLSKHKEDSITVPKVIGYDMYGKNELNSNISLIKQYKFGVRSEVFDKRIIFNPDFDMTYSLGAHPRGNGFEKMKNNENYCSSDEMPLFLLHYKLIGSRWFREANEMLPRIPEGQVWKDDKGIYQGVAKHYFKIVDNPEQFYIEKTQNGSAVFDEDGKFLPIKHISIE